MKTFLKKYVKHPIEAFVIIFIYIASKILGYKKGADFTALVFKTLAKIFKPRKKVIDKNLKIVFPEIQEEEKNKIITAMFDNWGRTTSEYCNIDYLYKNLEKHITVKNKTNLPKNAIYVSAHYGNFEIALMYILKNNIQLSQIYRKANNNIFNKIALYMQRNIPKKMVDRTTNASKKLVQALQKKESIFILSDQKIQTGGIVKFFGQNCKSAKGTASLSLKYNVPIIPVYVKRIDKYNFEVVFEEEIDKTSSDILIITELINKRFEKWILEKPEMWFWTHNRWEIKK